MISHGILTILKKFWCQHTNHSHLGNRRDGNCGKRRHRGARKVGESRSRVSTKTTNYEYGDHVMFGYVIWAWRHDDLIPDPDPGFLFQRARVAPSHYALCIILYHLWFKETCTVPTRAINKLWFFVSGWWCLLILHTQSSYLEVNALGSLDDFVFSRLLTCQDMRPAEQSGINNTNYVMIFNMPDPPLQMNLPQIHLDF